MKDVAYVRSDIKGGGEERHYKVRVRGIYRESELLIKSRGRICKHVKC